jgi:hypothetical protein
LLKRDEKPDVGIKSVEVKEVENPVNTASQEVVPEKAEGSPAAAEESTEVTPVTTEDSSEVNPAATESTEANSAAVENSNEAAVATEASSENSEEESAGDQEAAEETPEIKVSIMPRISSFHCYLIASIYTLFSSLCFRFVHLCTVVIQLETAPADFRFPTTNQTRHCFTRYIEYHR